MGQCQHPPIATTIDTDQVTGALREAPQGLPPPQVRREPVGNSGQQVFLRPQRLQIGGRQIGVQLVHALVVVAETRGDHRSPP
jgi:hypothetical protein